MEKPRPSGPLEDLSDLAAQVRQVQEQNHEFEGVTTAELVEFTGNSESTVRRWFLVPLKRQGLITPKMVQRRSFLTNRIITIQGYVFTPQAVEMLDNQEDSDGQ